MSLSTVELVLILLVVLVIVVAVWLAMRKRRAEQLHSRFGAEYDRTVHQLGDEGKAQAALAAREKRVSSYTIKPLPENMRDHFVQTWQKVQAQFVDDPHYAVSRADDLLGEVMLARGYPVHDFDQQAEDLSVDHPDVVQHYRSGHDIAVRHARGEASTEDLRSAMLHYRALFDDLVNEPTRHSPADEGAKTTH